MPWPMRFGPGSEDHHPRPIGRADLALVLPRRVVVRRLGGELGGARVDGLERGVDTGRFPCRPHVGLGRRPQVSKLRVAEAESLGPPPRSRASRSSRAVDGRQLIAVFDDGQQLIEEPRIDAAGLVRAPRSCGRGGATRRSRRSGSGVGTAIAASRSSSLSGSSSASAGSQFSPARPCSSERSAFWRLSGNVRPIAITSPTDCICVPSTPVVPGSFSKAQRGTFVTT